MSSSSWLFSSTKRIVGRVAASHDPLGVAIVVLLRLDVGPDKFGPHQPDIVAVGGEHAAEMMSPRGGLGVSERDNFFPAFVFRTTGACVRGTTDSGIRNLGREKRDRLGPAQPPGENKPASQASC